MESEHVAITDLKHQIDRAFEVLDIFVFDARMDDKDAMKLRLLCEETLGLAMSIFETAHLSFWLSGDAKKTFVHLKTIKYLENAQKQKLLSVSTTGENVAYRGFMGKIHSLFANPAELSSKWTLKDYRESLKSRAHEDEDAKQAAEDMERSIVANIADDVEVSMMDDMVEMVITKAF